MAIVEPMATEALRQAVAMLGIRASVTSALDLAPLIRRGLPSASLTSVSKQMELSATVMVGALGLAQRTLARRIQEKQALTPEESERVVRLARVLAQATVTLSSLEKARRWLQKPSRALGGAVPLRMLDTDIGANAVLEELGRIDHGVFA